MTRTRRTAAALCAITAVGGAAVGVAAAVAGDTPTPTGRTVSTPPPPTLPRPRDFVAVVDNPYLPFVPGTRWLYRGYGEQAGERTVVTVLHRARTIEGITATVVHDVVEEGGTVTEDTYDWYAQDRLGNVWYLGEQSREYADGQVDTSGSWQAGAAGAQAGIVMPAHPVLGRPYAQEFRPGEAEDQAQVIDVGTQVGVPSGHFDDARLTSESSALEPRVVELKYYVRGVGLVAEVQASPRFGRSVLVSVVK